MGNGKRHFGLGAVEPRGVTLAEAPMHGPQAAEFGLSPYFAPPANGYFFDAISFAAIPTVAAGRVTVTSFTFPNGATGIVRWLANAFYGGGFVDGTGQVIWRIFLDSKPVQNYNNIQASLGSVALPTDTFIVCQEGQTVSFTVEVTVNQAGGTTTGCRLKGWYWSKAGQTG